MNRTVLISGASIAGPSLAYWLTGYGFQVTVVEKAATLRGGGYAIDIRGSALGVVDRMGLLPRLREAHVGTRKISFVDPGGAPIGSVTPEALAGDPDSQDLEVRRGDLAEILYAPIRDRAEFVFNDSVAALDDDGDRVRVAFGSGTRRDFDLVIGADGLHSRTRQLVFGPEEPFHRYLGHTFALFSLPNDLGLAHEAVLWNAPGKAAAVYAHDPADRMFALLAFARQDPPFDAFRDPAAQRRLVAAMFPERAWHVPRLVAAMREADDLFFDIVSQIRMPAWSRGRVALAGDAAHATSFQSGQGSSVALAGAYILAGELASHDDHADAFAAYEKKLRPFAERNQDLATAGGWAVIPATQDRLDARNRVLTSGEPGALRTGEARAAHTSLALPDYGSASSLALSGK